MGHLFVYEINYLFVVLLCEADEQFALFGLCGILCDAEFRGIEESAGPDIKPPIVTWTSQYVTFQLTGK
jgi:hypothetical protein